MLFPVFFIYYRHPEVQSYIHLNEGGAKQPFFIV